MKKKIVIWGNDEADKKVLIALELKAKENKIAIHQFPEEIATEVFYNELMDNWRADKEIVFPEGHTTIERELNVTESILPDNIKVTRSDLINRASTEWHFVVLSTKLFEMYRSELEEKKEKVMEMTRYEGSSWNEMKDFWKKVQQQVFDNNLLRNHANQLKDGTNKVFEKLKELRTAVDKEFDEVSKKNKVVFAEKLGTVEEKIEKGLGLKPLFEELKRIQGEYKDTKFNKKDRSEIWDRLDAAFKKVKDKKFGGSGTGNNNSQAGRVERRMNGLNSAISKMQNSINRDQKDIDYEDRKINTSDGQLEQQIRQAKLKMIQGRITSKKIKLDDMLATKKQLQSKLEKEQKREEVAKAKQAAKAKIATKIESQSAALSPEEQAKLESAAKKLAESKAVKKAPKTETKAVVAETEVKKLEPTEEKQEISSQGIEKVDTEVKEDVVTEVKEEVQAEGGILGAVGGLMDSAKDMVEDAIDTVTAAASVAKETVEEALKGTKDSVDDQVGENESVPSATKIRENAVSELLDSKEPESKDISGIVSEKIEEKVEDKGILGAASGLVGGLMSAATELAGDAMEKIQEISEVVEEKVEGIVDTITEEVKDLTEEE